jgi:hypothetical protein
MARILILLLLYSKLTAAQQNQIAVTSPIHEKIYVHFDKPYYEAGDMIWFKAYLYSNGMPSTSSHNFYVQLTNASGQVVGTLHQPISNATVAGSFQLPDSLPDGYYEFRATTPLISSTDPSFIYLKRMYVHNRTLKPGAVSKSGKHFSLQFFPESGNLIDRLRTQVAFKASDDAGLPLPVSGFIKKDLGEVVTAFNTVHDGMGRVMFTPHLADKLYAEVISGKDTSRFPLSAVMPSGVNLKISNEPGGKLFELTRSKAESQKYDTVQLQAIMNDEVVFETEIVFGFDYDLRGHLKTADLPSGILHFKLLNKDGAPLAERTCFVNNNEYATKTSIDLVKRDNSKRALNTIDIKFPDSIQRSCSISITDLSANEFPEKDNIYSRLLLQSDLKGMIYNPAYYFRNLDDSTLLALDNLVLIHGWSRYQWTKNPGNPVSAKQVYDPYLIQLSGSITNAEKQLPVSNGQLVLQVEAGEPAKIQTFEIPVNKEGRFCIDSLLFSGDARIYYSYTGSNGKTQMVNVQLDKKAVNESNTLFTLAATGQREPGITFIPQQNLLPDGRFRELPVVTLEAKTGKASDKINERYASTLFRGSGKLVLDNITDPYSNASLNVVDYILENIRTVELNRAQGVFVNSKNFSLQNQQKWKMEIFVDETASTLNVLRSTSLGQVAMIKFFEAGFVGAGSGSPGGAIAVYLKKGEDTGPATTVSAEKYIQYKGYSITREFYHPDYSVANARHELPDNRITLYWNPSVITTPGERHFKFNMYNNDYSKKWFITIEGFDSKGKLIHEEQVIE